MKKINYENKNSKQKIEICNPTIFDRKNIIYKDKDKNIIHIYNIDSRNHEFFISEEINDMILLDISGDDHTIITCSKNGEVNQYTLKGTFVEYINIFKDNEMSFSKILKINKNKILLFKDDFIFYLFNLETKQIETKIKFENESYFFLSIILDENKFNFTYYYKKNYEVKEKQLAIFEKLGIKIKTKN